MRRASLFLLALASGACGQKGGEGAAPPPPAKASSQAVDRPPLDTTLPGELAEGTHKAFGLAVPRRMKVYGNFNSVVFASGFVPVEDVANYVRKRVTAERVETGPTKTVFLRATLNPIKGEPPRAPVPLRIEVEVKAGETQLTVRDETAKPPEPGLTDEERWRKAGFKPDGTPADPSRFE